MPIRTNRNANYGPPTVNQKYRPLDNIVFSGTDRALYSALLINRATWMEAASMLPKPLELLVPRWSAVIASETGKRPPLVVISSNRSGWIAAGFAALDRELTFRDVAHFDNASDLRAIAGRGERQTLSPPIYAPKRIGDAGPRNVYIVVHANEYKTYKDALNGLGVTVVGWQFSSRRRASGPPQVVGFGASRFAAIEFCKTLRTHATPSGGAAPWNYAWLLDDNTVALSNFAGYRAVEDEMTEAEGAPFACAGFRGGTVAEDFTEIRDWARREVDAGEAAEEGSDDARRGRQSAALPTSHTPAIVQQASLWNIDYLTTHHLNFGPLYVASAEDLSIGKYFDAQEIPYLHYEGIGVRKELPGFHDDTAGARATNAARQALATWFAAAESTAGEGAPPPPVNIRSTHTDDAGDGERTIAWFITNRVLPNSPMAAQRNDGGVLAAAKCQALEQITCGAIENDFVTTAGLESAFKINGTHAQSVRRVDTLPRPRPTPPA